MLTRRSTSRLSPAQMALLEQRLKGRPVRTGVTNAIPRRAESDWVPLSFIQQETLRAQTGKVPPTYLGTVLHYAGHLDIEALQRSVNEVSRRHETLRTNFATNQTGAIVQVINPHAPVNVKVVELSDLPDHELIHVARQRALEELAKPFDSEQAPLWRVTVFCLDRDRYVLVVALDDLIADFLSIGILIQELGTLYEAFSHYRVSPLPELQIQYGDWAVWQRDSVDRGELNAQFSYWMDHLKDCPPPLKLPFARPRPTSRTVRGAVRLRHLPQTLSDALRNLSRQQKVGLYTVLLCAFGLLVKHYSGRGDFVLGRGVAGRTRVETEKLIGCFINMVVIRLNLRGNPTFDELLKRIQPVVDSAYANQDVPFVKLAEVLHPNGAPHDEPLARIFFNLYTAPPVMEIEGAGLSVFDLGDRGDEDVALFQDLILGMQDSGNRLIAELKYNRDLFEAGVMDQLLIDYQTYLETIVAAPKERIWT